MQHWLGGLWDLDMEAFGEKKIKPVGAELYTVILPNLEPGSLSITVSLVNLSLPVITRHPCHHLPSPWVSFVTT